MNIVEAAKNLVSDFVILDSYTAYDEDRQLWFFSKNPNLTTGKAVKPAKFSEWKNFSAWWKLLSIEQQRVLYTKINKQYSPYIPSERDYNRIKDAYEKWPSLYHAVYYGTSGSCCNIFIGEALYRAGYDKTYKGKYYSARHIWDAGTGFPEVKKSDVKPGDVAALDRDSNNDGGHVEIVTSVDGNSFCSIGAGRGSSGLPWIMEWKWDRSVWQRIDCNEQIY